KLTVSSEIEAYIQERCAEDPELAQYVREYVDGADATGEDESLDRPFERYLGQQIGPWTLKRFLGSGGFGVVFLAERKDPVQRAAIKLLQGTVHSRDTEGRFRQEQQALAKLSHPYIVHLKEPGLTAE